MKRLYRSKAERIFGGVCGGPGEDPDPDPTLIRRIRAVVTILSSGTGIVNCIPAWILIPEEETTGPVSRSLESGGYT